MQLVDVGRSVFYFTFWASVADTVLVMLATSSGYKLPSFAMFVPSSFYDFVYNTLQQAQQLQISSPLAYIASIAFLPIIMFIINMVLGVIGFFPILMYNLSSILLSFAPYMMPVVVALSAFAAFLQITVYLYIIYFITGIKI